MPTNQLKLHSQVLVKSQELYNLYKRLKKRLLLEKCCKSIGFKIFNTHGVPQNVLVVLPYPMPNSHNNHFQEVQTGNEFNKFIKFIL